MLTSLLLRTLLNFITINFQRLNLFWQSALQNPHKNARTTYKNRSRLSPTVFVAVGLRRAMWSLLRLNSTKRPTFAEMFRTPRLCPVLLSWVLTVITSPDATQLDKTVLLSWIGSGDVIEPLLTYLHAIVTSYDANAWPRCLVTWLWKRCAVEMWRRPQSDGFYSHELSWRRYSCVSELFICDAGLPRLLQHQWTQDTERERRVVSFMFTVAAGSSILCLQFHSTHVKARHILVIFWAVSTCRVFNLNLCYVTLRYAYKPSSHS